MNCTVVLRNVKVNLKFDSMRIEIDTFGTIEKSIVPFTLPLNLDTNMSLAKIKSKHKF